MTIDTKGEVLRIETNKSELEALDEVIKKWHFKNQEAFFRFALGALSKADPGKLYRQDKNGEIFIVAPTSSVTEINI